MTRRIYLDWAATAPVDAVALAAFDRTAADWANPSSVHAGGRGAAAALDTARRQVAAALGVAAAAIVFTGGGTEALGIALAQHATHLVSAVEHDAVLAQAPGAGVIPVDGDGIVDLAALAAILAVSSAASPLVAVMHANNETGVVQPVAAVAAIAARHGARLLVDAVQTAGKLPLPDADYVAVSAHKLGGVPGVGALVTRAPVTALVRGGGQERGQRAGTENVPGIAAFAAAAAARAADAGWNDRAVAMRDRLEAQLPGGVVLGGGAPRLGTISCVRLPGVAAMTQLMLLDLAGIAVSAGAACSSGKVRASHVLAAMGVPAGEAIRFSLGWTTTAADVDAAAAAWRAMAARLRPMAA